MIFNGEIKLYEEKYFKELCELIQRNFWADTNIEETILWKFFHYPAARIYLALSEGVVVGQYNNIALPINIEGKRVFQGICQDMCVDSLYRWQKIISQLSKRTYDKSRFSFTIGFSNSAGVKVDQNAKDYGYRVLGSFTKIVIPIVPNFLLRAESFSFRQTSKFSYIPKTLDTYSIYKDKSYLTWRYIDKPNSVYKIWSIYNAVGSLGYIVTKTEGKKLYVLDIICDDMQENRVAIINTLQQIGKQQETRYIILNVLYNDFWKTFLEKMFCFKSRSAHHYFTIKNHDDVYQNNLDKNNWILQLWDIL